MFSPSDIKRVFTFWGVSLFTLLYLLMLKFVPVLLLIPFTFVGTRAPLQLRICVQQQRPIRHFGLICVQKEVKWRQVEFRVCVGGGCVHIQHLCHACWSGGAFSWQFRGFVINILLLSKVQRHS